MDFVSKQDKRENRLNSNTETKDNNLINILSSPQFLLNLSKINDLSKINEQNNQTTTSQTTTTTTSFETYLLYIIILIIIILLIVDIVLRLGTKPVLI